MVYFLTISLPKHLNECGAVCSYCGVMCDKCEISDFNPKEYWQYHLQQMVLFENPIDYLRKFI